jgi:hypothetical protein
MHGLVVGRGSDVTLHDESGQERRTLGYSQ